MEANEQKTLLERIELSLDGIRPYLKADGGNIQVAELTDEGVLKIRLMGACETCKMSYQTMKVGVEEVILRSVPEVKSIVAINQLEQAG